jgi:biotin transport system substrate-specific component
MNPEAATLRLALFPRSSFLTDVLLVLAGTGFVALAAQVKISLSFTPVPITGQTFAVVLVGASLGALLGLASLGLYLFVGALGAPIYAEGQGGWDVLTGPTGGYIVGFCCAAALVGWMAQQRWDRRFNSAVAAMLTGNVVIYLFGLPWLGPRGDAGSGSLSVRRRRSSQALPRGRAPSQRLEARPAAARLAGVSRPLRRVPGTLVRQREEGAKWPASRNRSTSRCP